MNYKKEISNILDSIDSNYEHLKDTEEFISITEKENNWLCNIEDKLTLLQDNNDEIVIRRVIEHIKDKEYYFTDNDIDDLETFTRKIDKIIKIADMLNNFKNSKLRLVDLFNDIKKSIDISEISKQGYGVPQYLQQFLPHLYSVIKNCQEPSRYPINYKFWKNIIREVLKQKDDYSTMCQIYNSLDIDPINKKHIYFGAYFGVMATKITKEIKSKKIVKSRDSKEYRWINKHLLNLDPYLTNIISESYEAGVSDETEDNNGEKNMTDKCNNDTLNQILYGPPGTGKTYNTINKTLEIIFSAKDIVLNKEYKIYKNNKSTDEKISYLEAKKQNNRDGLKSIYDYFYNKGQIKFITFHQSYGYEEFVEGIKPCDMESGCAKDTQNITYAVKDGVFKELSNNAKNNLVNSQDTSEKKIDFEKLINDYGIYVNEQIGNGTYIDIKHSSYKIIAVKKDTNDSDVVKSFIVGKGENSQNLSNKILLRDIEKFFNNEIKDYTDIKPTRDSTSSYHGNATYYFELFKLLEQFYNNNKKQYYIKDKTLKNYILIIDEINRGNISKIFGELITLIEPSKRIGADEEIRVNLPYSNDDEAFGVPKNLYIIGTMNTADRSIAQIDTALRRRFVFEEMMPKPKLLTKNKIKIAEEDIYEDRDNDLKVENINIRLMLQAINERIEYIYDREHTVGHSYFMDLLKDGCNTKDKLDEIFRVNIIPLLAEYFYGDWGDIVEVLNDDSGNFIIDRTANLKHKPKTDRQNKVYAIKENFNTCGYIKIYNGQCKDEILPLDTGEQE